MKKRLSLDRRFLLYIKRQVESCVCHVVRRDIEGAV